MDLFERFGVEGLLRIFFQGFRGFVRGLWGFARFL